jgi:hypothetical protein
VFQFIVNTLRFLISITIKKFSRFFDPFHASVESNTHPDILGYQTKRTVQQLNQAKEKLKVLDLLQK